MLLQILNHDMKRIWNDVLKDVDRERKMGEKIIEYSFMQSEWGWKIEMKERSMSTHTLKGGERMEEIWMKKYTKEYGECIEEILV